MAYDKIITIHNRLDHCVDYVLNEEKTGLSAALGYIAEESKAGALVTGCLLYTSASQPKSMSSGLLPSPCPQRSKLRLPRQLPPWWASSIRNAALRFFPRREVEKVEVMTPKKRNVIKLTQVKLILSILIHPSIPQRSRWMR